ncbi:uncharacterized protein LOC112092379 [Morus notabilis]|uniref:uncharacterized protein LOC112092379 n=1 Tax=Morus notabilis TaxID=981085 RepID=UPI000CECE9CE|nr:uncharacterized protein LOC112092379 [Morus notabilis]
MKSDPNQRNQSKYCRFHGDVGQHTNDCVDLKVEIERLIPEGRLQEFKAERRGHGPGNDGRRREENWQGEDREPVGVIRTIHGGPYLGGDSRKSQKSYAHEARGYTRRGLEKMSWLLYGFTGDSVIPQGMIRLSITTGEKPR